MLFTLVVGEGWGEVKMGGGGEKGEEGIREGRQWGRLGHKDEGSRKGGTCKVKLLSGDLGVLARSA